MHKADENASTYKVCCLTKMSRKIIISQFQCVSARAKENSRWVASERQTASNHTPRFVHQQNLGRIHNSTRKSVRMNCPQNTAQLHHVRPDQRLWQRGISRRRNYRLTT